MSLRHATLRQLRIFECAARHRHFGRAAQELHLTQPAVSLQIKQLEMQAGVALFERVGRRVDLTRAGDLALSHTRQILAALREAEEALEALRGTGGGSLTIAVLSTGKYYTPKLLVEFRRLHPAVEIRFAFNNRESVLRALAENAVDLAVMGGVPRGIDAVAVPFAEHPLAFIAAPEHRLARARRMSLARLSGETFVMREPGSGTRATLDKFFAAHKFRPREIIEFESNESIKQAVMGGLGVSFLSLHTTGLELATGRIAVLDVRNTPVIRAWNIVHLKRKRLTPAAAAFKAFIVREGSGIIQRALEGPPPAMRQRRGR